LRRWGCGLANRFRAADIGRERGQLPRSFRRTFFQFAA